jgi:hypothetical protein
MMRSNLEIDREPNQIKQTNMALEKENTVSTPLLSSSSSPSSSSPSTLPPTRPNSEASPSVVRDYLAAVLSTYHDVPEDTARAIASGWKYGRGSEFAYYDVQTFRDMFGSEAGNLLYGHARRQMKRSSGTRVTPTAATDENNNEDIFGLPPGCK